MAVGLASKNATTALCSYLERMQQASAASAAQQATGGDEPGTSGQGLGGTLSAIVSLLASDQGERLLSLLITKSIKTAVSTYVDATLGYNMYDDMIASIAKQVSSTVAVPTVQWPAAPCNVDCLDGLGARVKRNSMGHWCCCNAHSQLPLLCLCNPCPAGAPGSSHRCHVQGHSCLL
jgi:hypothetical protein